MKTNHHKHGGIALDEPTTYPIEKDRRPYPNTPTAAERRQAIKAKLLYYAQLAATAILFDILLIIIITY